MPKRLSLRLSDSDFMGTKYISSLSVLIKNKAFSVKSLTDNKLNQFGEIVVSYCKEITLHYIEADNAVFIVTPNHIHEILLSWT